MKDIQIKNYDVALVKTLLVLLPFIISYAIIFFLVLIVDGHLIYPIEYVTHIFDDTKPIALLIVWGIIVFTAIFLIKRNKHTPIKDSTTMKAWMSFKNWVLTLGDNFESK